MKKIFLFTGLVILSVIMPKVTIAAQLYVVGENKIGTNGDVLVTLAIDSVESINALEGELIWPAGLLKVKDVRFSDSLINFWITEPTSTPDSLVFSGIIPGGRSANKTKILEVVFHAEEAGSGSIGFKSARVLLNNREGTMASVISAPLVFTVDSTTKTKIINREDFNDSELPESFTPQFGQDPNVFAGKNFIVFATSDKKSGLAYFEIKESKYRVLSYFKEWKRVESPYVLTDQTLHSHVYIKAVDRAGNGRIIKVNPQTRKIWYENIIIWGIIILVILLVITRRFKDEKK